MPNVNLYNQEGKEIGKAELTSEIFDVKLNSNLVHQAVVAAVVANLGSKKALVGPDTAQSVHHCGLAAA